MSYLIISTSLNADSRSRAMARAVEEKLRDAEVSVDFFDLQDHPLPPCGSDGCYEAENVQLVAEKIKAAPAVLLATPIYNYAASSSAKNLIELTGQSWVEKPVGFLCAAGGSGSYMSIMGMANHLMLDFRSIVIPRFVYAHGESFDGNTLTDESVDDRIRELAQSAIQFGQAFSKNDD